MPTEYGTEPQAESLRPGNELVSANPELQARQARTALSQEGTSIKVSAQAKPGDSQLPAGFPIVEFTGEADVTGDADATNKPPVNNPDHPALPQIWEPQRDISKLPEHAADELVAKMEGVPPRLSDMQNISQFNKGLKQITDTWTEDLTPMRKSSVDLSNEVRSMRRKMPKLSIDTDYGLDEAEKRLREEFKGDVEKLKVVDHYFEIRRKQDAVNEHLNTTLKAREVQVGDYVSKFSQEHGLLPVNTTIKTGDPHGKARGSMNASGELKVLESVVMNSGNFAELSGVLMHEMAHRDHTLLYVRYLADKTGVGTSPTAAQIEAIQTAYQTQVGRQPDQATIEHALALRNGERLTPQEVERAEKLMQSQLTGAKVGDLKANTQETYDALIEPLRSLSKEEPTAASSLVRKLADDPWETRKMFDGPPPPMVNEYIEKLKRADSGGEPFPEEAARKDLQKLITEQIEKVNQKRSSAYEGYMTRYEKETWLVDQLATLDAKAMNGDADAQRQLQQVNGKIADSRTDKGGRTVSQERTAGGSNERLSPEFHNRFMDEKTVQEFDARMQKVYSTWKDDPAYRARRRDAQKEYGEAVKAFVAAGIPEEQWGNRTATEAKLGGGARAKEVYDKYTHAMSEHSALDAQRVEVRQQRMKQLQDEINAFGKERGIPPVTVVGEDRVPGGAKAAYTLTDQMIFLGNDDIDFPLDDKRHDLTKSIYHEYVHHDQLSSLIRYYADEAGVSGKPDAQQIAKIQEQYQKALGETMEPALIERVLESKTQTLSATERQRAMELERSFAQVGSDGMETLNRNLRTTRHTLDGIETHRITAWELIGKIDRGELHPEEVFGPDVDLEKLNKMIETQRKISGGQLDRSAWNEGQNRMTVQTMLKENLNNLHSESAAQHERYRDQYHEVETYKAHGKYYEVVSKQPPQTVPSPAQDGKDSTRKTESLPTRGTEATGAETTAAKGPEAAKQPHVKEPETAKQPQLDRDKPDWSKKKPPTLGDMGDAGATHKDTLPADHLSLGEIARLKQMRQQLEARQNMTPEQLKEVEAIRKTEIELSKPDARNTSAVRRIRESLSGKAGTLSGIAIVVGAALAIYNHRNSDNSDVTTPRARVAISR